MTDTPHQPPGDEAGEMVYVEGAISIAAVIEADSRPVDALIVRDDLAYDPAAVRLKRLARDRGIAVETVSAVHIDRLAQGKTHGGLLARVGARRMLALSALVTTPDPCLVMFDGVEDPFNFGQAVRACYAAGVTGTIVRPRNWTSAVGVVARASAGASEWMPMAQAESAEAAAEVCRRHGLAVVVTDHRRAVSIYEADLTAPLLLVIGGEKRGVTRSFADAADLRLMIPYGRPFAQALDTTSAVAALVFEIARQRSKFTESKKVQDV